MDEEQQPTSESFQLTSTDRQEIKKAPERPIHKVVWNEAPTGDIDKSVRERWSEFFRSPEVPAQVQALGALTIESMVEAAKGIEQSTFTNALYNQGQHPGRPTIYGIALYNDRVDVLFSALHEYGEFSLSATELPLAQLDQLTGGIANDLVTDRPDVVQGLLASNVEPERVGSAKLSLMRYLAEKKPGSVKVLAEMGYYRTGVAYSPDGVTKSVKLYLAEIPESDPILGEWVEFLNQAEMYKQMVTKFDNEEHAEMTTAKIADYLKRMPSWAQRAFMGRYPDHGNKAWRIMDVFNKLGYHGNEKQQKWSKTQRLSSTFLDFTNEIKGKMFSAVIDPHNTAFSPELPTTEIDALFRTSYATCTWEQCPSDFSITKAIQDEIPLSGLTV